MLGFAKFLLTCYHEFIIISYDIYYELKIYEELKLPVNVHSYRFPFHLCIVELTNVLTLLKTLMTIKILCFVLRAKYGRQKGSEALINFSPKNRYFKRNTGYLLTSVYYMVTPVNISFSMLLNVYSALKLLCDTEQKYVETEMNL